ncbi:MAG: BON domain-containing protein [Gammaproteobacteria bacterium]
MGGWQSGQGRQGQSQSYANRGPKGYKRSDERLKEDISERLMQSHHIDPSEVSIEVKDGKVTLEGTVTERHMKHAIEDLVEACPGVQDVDNRVRVQRAGAENGGTSLESQSGMGSSSSAMGSSSLGGMSGSSSSGSSGASRAKKE